MAMLICTRCKHRRVRDPRVVAKALALEPRRALKDAGAEFGFGRRDSAFGILEPRVLRAAAELLGVCNRCHDKEPCHPRCCVRAGEYNGFASDGPHLFECQKRCPCHD